MTDTIIGLNVDALGPPDDSQDLNDLTPVVPPHYLHQTA